MPITPGTSITSFPIPTADAATNAPEIIAAIGAETPAGAQAKADAAQAAAIAATIAPGSVSSFGIFVPKTKIISAANAGAALNANPLTGGGTDDYAVLQAILDSAPEVGSIELHIEGSFLISATLRISSNTTIIMPDGYGPYLANGVNEAIWMNKNWTRAEPGDIVRPDKNITIVGGFWNGNNLNQTHNSESVPSHFCTGAYFSGVENLTLEKFELRNARSFGVEVANANNVRIRNARIKWTQSAPVGGLDYYARVNEDGIHFNGPLENVLIENIYHNGGDDAVALNIDEIRSFPEIDRLPHSYGPGSDITVRNLVMDGSSQGVRIISMDDSVQRILVDGIHGTFEAYAFRLDNLLSTSGNFADITVRNIDAKPIAGGNPHYGQSNDAAIGGGGLWNVVSLMGQGGNISISNVSASDLEDARPAIYMGPNLNLDHLTLDNIVSDATPANPADQLHETYGPLVRHASSILTSVGGDFLTQPMWQKAVAAYNFDEASGAARVDATGYGATLADHNTVVTAPSPFGRAVSLNGINQYLSGAVGIGAEFTVAGWFQVTDHTAARPLAGQWPGAPNLGWLMFVTTGGKVKYNTSTGSGITRAVESTSSIVDGTWFFASIRVKDQRLVGRLNLEDYGWGGGYIGSLNLTANMVVGAVPADGSWLLGSAARLQVWNRCLAIHEMDAIYNAGEGRFYPES